MPLSLLDLRRYNETEVNDNAANRDRPFPGAFFCSGNLPRHCDRFLLSMEIATEVGALARNDREFVLTKTRAAGALSGSAGFCIILFS